MQQFPVVPTKNAYPSLYALKQSLPLSSSSDTISLSPSSIQTPTSKTPLPLQQLISPSFHPPSILNYFQKYGVPSRRKIIDSPNANINNNNNFPKDNTPTNSIIINQTQSPQQDIMKPSIHTNSQIDNEENQEQVSAPSLPPSSPLSPPSPKEALLHAQQSLPSQLFSPLLPAQPSHPLQPLEQPQIQISQPSDEPEHFQSSLSSEPFQLIESSHQELSAIPISDPPHSFQQSELPQSIELPQLTQSPQQSIPAQPSQLPESLPSLTQLEPLPIAQSSPPVEPFPPFHPAQSTLPIQLFHPSSLLQSSPQLLQSTDSQVSQLVPIAPSQDLQPLQSTEAISQTSPPSADSQQISDTIPTILEPLQYSQTAQQMAPFQPSCPSLPLLPVEPILPSQRALGMQPLEQSLPANPVSPMLPLAKSTTPVPPIEQLQHSETFTMPTLPLAKSSQPSSCIEQFRIAEPSVPLRPMQPIKPSPLVRLPQPPSPRSRPNDPHLPLSNTNNLPSQTTPFPSEQHFLKEGVVSSDALLAWYRYLTNTVPQPLPEPDITFPIWIPGLPLLTYEKQQPLLLEYRKDPQISSSDSSSSQHTQADEVILLPPPETFLDSNGTYLPSDTFYQQIQLQREVGDLFEPPLIVPDFLQEYNNNIDNGQLIPSSPKKHHLSLSQNLLESPSKKLREDLTPNNVANSLPHSPLRGLSPAKVSTSNNDINSPIPAKAHDAIECKLV